jgi:hypothetical protein
MGGSVNPGTQDPDALVDLDARITEIWDYLKDNIFPDEHVPVEWIVHVAKRYMLVFEDLYRHGANGVLMRSITQEDGCELLTKIHGGECGNHASSCMVVDKAFRHGFYWPTIIQDAIELVKRRQACQFYAKWIHTLAQMLQMIPPRGHLLYGGWTSWVCSPRP